MEVRMNRFYVAIVSVVLFAPPRTSLGQNPSPLMQALASELTYAMEHLKASDGTQPYFIGYSVYDEQRAIVSATLHAARP